jgi:hypothetical protein
VRRKGIGMRASGGWRRGFAGAAAMALGSLGAFDSARAAEDLLPDMITLPATLADHYLDWTTIPGRVLLRLSSSTPNIGRGALEIQGRAVVSELQREVVQRIYRDDGSFSDRLAGTFTHHPEHAHVHFDGWAAYRLRAITDEGGVGEVIAEGAKTSFCLLDLVEHNLAHPEIGPSRYKDCGFDVQGISAGWSDVYQSGLPDQWIDVTGIPNGSYWLEAEVDPLNAIVELNDANNVSRIEMMLGGVVEPDRFEENDSREQVAARAEAAPDSPNLGLLAGPLELSELSIEGEDDSDFFRFELAQAAASGSFVRIASVLGGGDLDLELLDADGTPLARSSSTGNVEEISLEGRPAGVYYAVVYAFEGRNPDYRLQLNSTRREPPSIQVLVPTAGTAWIEQAFETAQVAWVVRGGAAPMTVALFVDRDRKLDKETLGLPGYTELDAASNVANVNTVGLALGRWHVHATVSGDAGQSGSWSPGSFYLYRKGDVDFDGDLDREDLLAVNRALARREFAAGWSSILDMDRDGDVDRADLAEHRKQALRRRPHAHP